MAIQVVPNQQSFGGSIGSALGSGLGQGLSMLVQNKLGELQNQKRAQAWESIGLAPEMAHFIVQSPEWLQKEIVGRLEGLGQPQVQQLPQSSDINNQQMMQQVKAQKAPSVRVGPNKEESKKLSEERKIAHEQQKEISKHVLPYIKDLQTKAKSAKENDLRLNRMEKLIETGKLNNPVFASVLKTLNRGVGGIFGHVGLDLSSLLSPESQEFEKISNDFIKGAKDIFGSRITDADIKYFLSTIPNLAQTNEGKMAVIRNLKLMNKAAEIKSKAARELLKYYNNRPPLDFESQVDELVQPELDAIAKEFESGSIKKSKQTSTLPGDVVGGLGQALLGVS